MNTLVADSVVAGYGKQEIVHGVSLVAEAGEITCIFGPNGCGKSTLLKAIAGALPVWGGTIGLGGKTISKLPVHEVVRQGLVLMPQGGGVFPRLTVMENLRMGGYAIAGRKLVDRRIEALVDQYPSLARRRKTTAGALSGGEQAMLALARALVSEPRFILLDEPSAGLSPTMVIETLERIKALIARAASASSWSSRTFARPCRSPTGSTSWPPEKSASKARPVMSATTGRSWTSIWAAPDAGAATPEILDHCARVGCRLGVDLPEP